MLCIFDYSSQKLINKMPCQTGSVQKGAVRRAVEEFAAEHNVTVYVTEPETRMNLSWMMQKPL
jgi:hypothetical protein